MSAQPEKRTQVAGALVVTGLGIEWLTLHWSHPTAFFVFAGIGGLCLGLGALIFLTTLLTDR